MKLNTMRRQSAAKPVGHREWHEDREHKQHRETLARVKAFEGDVDKSAAEYLHDIGFASGQSGECNRELKDCVSEPRRILQRVLRQESLRSHIRVQVCLRESFRGLFRVWIRVRIRLCPHEERKRCATALRNQVGIDKRDCEEMRVPIAHNSDALNKSNASRMPSRRNQSNCGFWRMRCENQVLGSKSYSA